MSPKRRWIMRPASSISPDAAASQNVNEEVRLFRWLHPDWPVIPLIVAAPPASQGQMCSPLQHQPTDRVTGMARQIQSRWSKDTLAFTVVFDVNSARRPIGCLLP